MALCFFIAIFDKKESLFKTYCNMHFVYFITMLLYVGFTPFNSSEKGKFFLLMLSINSKYIRTFATVLKQAASRLMKII